MKTLIIVYEDGFGGFASSRYSENAVDRKGGVEKIIQFHKDLKLTIAAIYWMEKNYLPM